MSHHHQKWNKRRKFLAKDEDTGRVHLRQLRQRGNATALHDEALSHNANRQPTIEFPQNPDLVWRGIDLSYAHFMLNRCRNGHQRCRTASLFQSKSTARELLLVDVHRLCLVPASPEHSYIALSYVWGAVRQFQTSRENLSRLQEADALTNYFDQIPLVIKDAIQVTKVLGEGYLWVDSLCIVQNDPEVKHHQIKHMGDVYLRSALTLVALGGSRASDPLNSGQKNSGFLQYPQENAMSITSYVSSLQMKVLCSVHNERAWTFQERILSPRCLFFYDTLESPFFVCRQEIACDVPRHFRDDEEYSTRIMVPKAHLLNPLASFFDGLERFRNVPLRRFETCSRYDQLVSWYTARKLSYSSDVLDAFSGILKTLSASDNWHFVAGIPVETMAFGLLWTPVGSIRHRQRNQKSLTPRNSFPSWSWTGWQGRVDYHHIRAYDHVTDLRSCVSIFAYGHLSGQSTAKQRRPQPLLQRNASGRLDLRSSRIFKRTARPQDQLESLLEAIAADQRPEKNIYHVLQFTTQCCSASAFTFQGGPTWTNYGVYSCPSDRDLVQIGLLGNKYCGLLHGICLQDNNFDLGDVTVSISSCDLVLISEMYGMKVYEDEQCETGGIDESFFPHRPWCILNVMLVQRQGTVANRVAIGHVHADAWASSDPVERLVSLG